VVVIVLSASEIAAVFAHSEPPKPYSVAQEDHRRALLDLAEGIAARQNATPDIASRALKQMAENGTPYPVGVANPDKAPSWAELTKDAPHLAQYLIEDSRRAAALSGDRVVATNEEWPETEEEAWDRAQAKEAADRKSSARSRVLVRSIFGLAPLLALVGLNRWFRWLRKPPAAVL